MTRSRPPRYAQVITTATALLYATLPVAAPPAPAAAAPAREASGASLIGTVFRDVDHDGRRDPGEPPVPGVTIRAAATGTGGAASAVGEGPAATAAAGGHTGTIAAASTDVSGRYELRGLGPVGRRLRVELASPPRGLYPGPGGDHGASDVRFLTLTTGPRVDSSATDIGLADPADYCHARSRVATACQFGDPPASRSGSAPPASTRAGTPAALPSAVQTLPWAAGGRAGSFGPGRSIGSVWGLAWQRESRRLLAAAFVKPYSRLGPGGPGAIYVMRAERDSTQVRLLTRLDAGAVPASVPDQAARVGTVGLGGLDISPDGRRVFAMNLHDRRLYVIPVTNPRGGWPAMAGSAVGYPVPDPGCDSGDARPFAVRAYRTKVYVGVTCDGAQVGAPSGPYRQLTGQVYSFDTEARGFDPTPRLRFTFDAAIRCDAPGQQACYWRPWVAQPVPAGAADRDVLLTAHQPWLSDIDFLGTGDGDGDMVISIMDRLGHQVADGAPLTDLTAAGKPADRGTTKARIRMVPVGGSLRAVLRSDGSYALVDSTSAHFYSGGGLGGLAYRGGDSLAAVTVANPGAAGLVYVHTGQARNVRVSTLVDGGVTASGGRAPVVGLSEPELLCDAAPLEIGDRVWRDGNGDGIQGADEPGIGGVTVTLRDSRGQVVATTKTSRDGRYTFTDDDVSGGIARYARYQVSLSRAADFGRRGPLAGTHIAPGGVGEETVDSDAQAPRAADVLGRDNLPAAAVTTAGSGRYDHGNDFGIMPPGVRAAPPAVGPGADTDGRGSSAGRFDPVMMTGLSGGVGLIALGWILLLLRRFRR